MSSAICFSLDQSKILSSGNGLRRRTFNNILEKGENARRSNQHFLKIFFTFSKKHFLIYATFSLSSANALTYDQSKILSFGNNFLLISVYLFPVPVAHLSNARSRRVVGKVRAPLVL